ncbi:hypothetical protein B0H13DRAFT_2086704, partial [Mycena leptocephala]
RNWSKFYATIYSKDVLFMSCLIYRTIFCRGSLQITSAGFQFLPHSPHAQLWDLLLQYLHLAEV